MTILFLFLLQAQVIMKFAEKAGSSAQAEARLQKAPFAAPPSGALPQATHASDAGRSQSDFRDSKSTTSQMALPARPSSVPSHPARSVGHVERSPSEQKPANEKLDRGKAPLVHEKPPMPVKITVTPEPGNPRPVRQNVMLKRKWPSSFLFFGSFKVGIQSDLSIVAHFVCAKSFHYIGVQL